MQRRKVTFKCYPNAGEAERLEGWVRLHCELYNAALQERIDAFRKTGKSISYIDQQNLLPAIKTARPEFVELGSHALQQTLRRLDLAFQAFFRRVKAGQTPGFPRFKASARFTGFCYPDLAGWKLIAHGGRGATIRIGSGAGAMMLRARGRHRFGPNAVPNDLTITRKNGEWFATITLRVPEAACARARTDHHHRGVDFGIADWATFANGDAMASPRWERNELPRLADLHRQRAKKKTGSVRYKRLSRQAAQLYERIGNLRREFLHQETAKLVRTCAVIVTESEQVKDMNRSDRGTVATIDRNVTQVTRLRREILVAGFCMAHQMLLYKAEEAGSRLHLMNSHQLKPSQRCAGEGGGQAQDPYVTSPPEASWEPPGIWDRRNASSVVTDKCTPGTGVAARPTPPARQMRPGEVYDPRNPPDSTAWCCAVGEFISPKFSFSSPGGMQLSVYTSPLPPSTPTPLTCHAGP